MEQETQVPEWKRKMLEAQKSSPVKTEAASQNSIPEWKRKMLEAQNGSAQKAPEIPPVEDPTKAKAPFPSAQSSASQSASSAGPAKQASATKAGQKEEPGFWASLGKRITGALATDVQDIAAGVPQDIQMASAEKKKQNTAEQVRMEAEAKREASARDLISSGGQLKYSGISSAKEQAKLDKEQGLMQQAMQQGFGPVSLKTAEQIDREKTKLEGGKFGEEQPVPLMPPISQQFREEANVNSKIISDYQSSDRVRPRFRPEEVQRAKANGSWSSVDEANLRQDAINYEAQRLNERYSTLQKFKDTQAGREFSELGKKLNDASNRVKDAEAKLPTNDPKFIQINQRAEALSSQLKSIAGELKQFESEEKRIEQEGKALQELYQMYESGAQIDQKAFNERVTKYNEDVQSINSQSAPYTQKYNEIADQLSSLKSQLGPFAEAYEQYKSAYDDYEAVNNEYEPIARKLQDEERDIIEGYDFVKKKGDMLESLRLTDPNYRKLQEKRMRVNIEEANARKGVGAFATLARTIDGGITSAKSAIYDALDIEHEEEGDSGLTRLGMSADNFWWSFVVPYANAGTKFAANTLTGAVRLVPGQILDPLAEDLSYFGDYVDASTPDVQNLPMYQQMSKAQSDYLDMLEEKYGDGWKEKASAEEMMNYSELEANAASDPDTVIRMASPRTILPKFVSTLTTSLAIMSSGAAASGSTRLSALLGTRGAGAVGTFGSTMAGTFEDNYKLALNEFGEGDGFFGSPAEQLALGLTSIEALVETLNLGPLIPGAKMSLIKDAVQLAKNGASRSQIFKRMGRNILTQGITEGPIEEELTLIAQQKLKSVFNAIENASLDDKITFTDSAEAMTLGFAAGAITSVATDSKTALQNSTLFAGSMMYAVNNKKEFTEYVNTNVPEADRKKVMEVFDRYSKIAESLPDNISMDDKAKLLVPIFQKENLIDSKSKIEFGGKKTILTEKIDAQIDKADKTINAILSKGKYGENLADVKEKSKAEREAKAAKMVADTEAIEQKYNIQVKFSPMGGFIIVPNIGVELTRNDYVAAVKEAQKVFGMNVRPAPRGLSSDEIVRKRELIDARDGVKETKTTDENGNEITVEAVAARPLTNEEKRELDALEQRDNLIKEFWGFPSRTWNPQSQARLNELEAKTKPTPQEKTEIETLRAKKKEFIELGGKGADFSIKQSWNKKKDQKRLDELKGTANLTDVEESEMRTLEMQKAYNDLLKLERDVDLSGEKTKAATQTKLEDFLKNNERISQIISKFGPTVEKLEQEGKLTRRCP